MPEPMSMLVALALTLVLWVDVRGPWQTALLAEGERAVHNMVLSHWKTERICFFVNGLGVVFCFHHPLHFAPVPHSFGY